MSFKLNVNGNIVHIESINITENRISLIPVSGQLNGQIMIPYDKFCELTDILCKFTEHCIRSDLNYDYE